MSENQAEPFDALVGDTSHPKSEILYSDDYLVITDKDITLKMYYFPIGTSRTLRFQQIKSFRVFKPRSIFAMKSWGMGVDFQVWWHWGGFGREFRERHAIVLDTGEWPSAGITPERGDPEAVRKVTSILNRYIAQDHD